MCEPLFRLIMCIIVDRTAAVKFLASEFLVVIEIMMKHEVVNFGGTYSLHILNTCIIIFSSQQLS